MTIQEHLEEMRTELWKWRAELEYRLEGVGGGMFTEPYVTESYAKLIPLTNHLDAVLEKLLLDTKK